MSPPRVTRRMATAIAVARRIPARSGLPGTCQGGSVLIPVEETSGNDGVGQSRGRFAPWDAPEGPGSSVEGQADHRLPPGARRDPSCGVAVVTCVKPIQP